MLLSLPFCFLVPSYGIMVWNIIAFLNPQSFTWGSATVFPWAVAAAVPTVLGTALFSRGWKNLGSVKVLLIVALWLWFTLTTVVSTHTAAFLHHAGDTWAKWQFVTKVLFMTLITVAAIDSFERLRKLLLVTAGCFGFFVVKALPGIVLSGGSSRLYGPEHSMIGDNNDFGLALNMTLPLFFFLAQTEPRRWVRYLFAFLSLATIPAIFFTYSRGALVGLIAVLGIMLLRSKHRILMMPVIVLGIIVALLFAPQAWKDRMDPNNAIDGSAKERFNAWAFSRNLAWDYPIAGGGFATFTPELFRVYAPVSQDIRGPHSIYFGVLAEHGYVGLALYLTLLFACFSGLWKVTKQARAHDDPVVAAYAQMLQFSLIAFLTSGMFLGRAYFDYFFTLVACIVVLEKVARARWAEQEENENALAGDGSLLEAHHPAYARVNTEGIIWEP